MLFARKRHTPRIFVEPFQEVSRFSLPNLDTPCDFCEPGIVFTRFSARKNYTPTYFLRVPLIMRLDSARLGLSSLVRACFGFCLVIEARNVMLEEIVN